MSTTATPAKKRQRREVETMEFLDTVVSRTIRRAGERVGDSDEPELVRLLQMRAELDAAIAVAVAGQRTRSSWEKLGSALGMTRQAAFQKWGRK